MSGDGTSKLRRRRTLVFAALTLLLSTAVTLAALEAGLRGMQGDWWGRPAAFGDVSMMTAGYPGVYHPTLGYVPEPGVSVDNVWGTSVTITEEGVRAHGRPPLATPPHVVAVGDSYTFGDEVNDAETWPAQLELELGRPVINGGVFGYGFDQIVLRAEQLLEHYDPDVLLVSLIPDDVLRCEYAYRYGWKPYFEIDDGGLALRNVPVPEPHIGPPGEALWRRALRWSFLADFVMRRLDPVDWPLPDSLRVHRQRGAVSRALVDRLASGAELGGHRVVLLLQWHPFAEPGQFDPIVDQARRRGVEVLSLAPGLRRVIREMGSPDPFFNLTRVDGRVTAVKHMTPRGNAWVAQAVAARLR